MKTVRFRSSVVFLSMLVALMTLTSSAAAFRQDTINIAMDPQERHSDAVEPYGWSCGAACLQANVDWITGIRYAQDDFWGFMRDRSCRELGGDDPLLPLTDAHPAYGDHGWEVRKLNIAYDFGADPHAVTWAMWYYGTADYHYYIYYNRWQATSNLLWTVESYEEPVMAAVEDGSHWITDG